MVCRTPVSFGFGTGFTNTTLIPKFSSWGFRKKGKKIKEFFESNNLRFMFRVILSFGTNKHFFYPPTNQEHDDHHHR